MISRQRHDSWVFHIFNLFFFFLLWIKPVKYPAPIHLNDSATLSVSLRMPTAWISIILNCRLPITIITLPYMEANEWLNSIIQIKISTNWNKHNLSKSYIEHLFSVSKASITTACHINYSCRQTPVSKFYHFYQLTWHLWWLVQWPEISPATGTHFNDIHWNFTLKKNSEVSLDLIWRQKTTFPQGTYFHFLH